MFTGIIKAIAIIQSLEIKNKLILYSISSSPYLLQQLETGNSVSIDGICQTVVEIGEGAIYFEAIEQTISCTTIKNWVEGRAVNIERSAKLGDEIGGHLLSGHVYGVALLEAIQDNTYIFSCPHSWLHFLFFKGYIAIDGVSLTLGTIDRERSRFAVHLIPETLHRTTLGSKQVGDTVNIEIDSLTQMCVERVHAILEQHALLHTVGSSSFS